MGGGGGGGGYSASIREKKNVTKQDATTGKLLQKADLLIIYERSQWATSVDV